MTCFGGLWPLASTIDPRIGEEVGPRYGFCRAGDCKFVLIGERARGSDGRPWLLWSFLIVAGPASDPKRQQRSDGRHELVMAEESMYHHPDPYLVRPRKHHESRDQFPFPEMRRCRDFRSHVRRVCLCRVGRCQSFYDDGVREQCRRRGVPIGSYRVYIPPNLSELINMLALRLRLAPLCLGSWCHNAVNERDSCPNIA
jgi:hypothetical protein